MLEVEGEDVKKMVVQQIYLDLNRSRNLEYEEKKIKRTENNKNNQIKQNENKNL